MSEFKQYKRTQIAEIRPVTIEEENFSATKMRGLGISVSPADIENGSPKRGDMIARNPKNHKDQWLIAKKYFEDNFERISSENLPGDLKNKTKDTEEDLRSAKKLATSASLAIDANIFELSSRMAALERALREYNEKVFKI